MPTLAMPFANETSKNWKNMFISNFIVCINFEAFHICSCTVLSRGTEVVDGLVLDKRFKCRGFADVITLKYLCAKVTGKDGWIYFVDMSEKMVERICASLRI